jgi:uncharacterized protein YjiS (DUF1127 family)
MLLNTLMTKVRLQINVWREVSQQRSDIRKLSDHLLDDIGLTRTHADRQVNRPFWDIAEKCDSSSFKHLRNTEIISQVRTCTIFKCIKYS